MIRYQLRLLNFVEASWCNILTEKTIGIDDNGKIMSSYSVKLQRTGTMELDTLTMFFGQNFTRHLCSNNKITEASSCSTVATIVLEIGNCTFS